MSAAPHLDTVSRNALVVANYYLSQFVVKKLWGLSQVKRLGWDEAMQVGLVTLIKAAERFNPAFGWTFSTYAMASMKREILKAARHNSLIHVPEYHIGSKKTPKNHEPSIYRHGAKAKQAAAFRASGGSAGQQGFLEIPDTASEVLQELIRCESRDRLLVALAKLMPRHRQVLQLRFWDGLTLRAAGKVLGLTKERVRQIQAAAVDRLRYLLGKS